VPRGSGATEGFTRANAGGGHYRPTPPARPVRVSGSKHVGGMCRRPAASWVTMREVAHMAQTRGSQTREPGPKTHKR
jgi:hypothetical protein